MTHPALEDTQEYACSHQARVIRYEALGDHRGRPKEHNERQPDRSPRPLEHGIAWYLNCYVEWEEDGEAIVVLQTMELKVLLEMVKTGIADVGSIEKTSAKIIRS